MRGQPRIPCERMRAYARIYIWIGVRLIGELTEFLEIEPIRSRGLLLLRNVRLRQDNGDRETNDRGTLSFSRNEMYLPSLGRSHFGVSSARSCRFRSVNYEIRQI